MGFGSGGTAGLLLAGGELSANRWLTYCDDFESIESDYNSLWTFDVTRLEKNLFCQYPIKAQVQNFALGLQRSVEIQNLENLFFL